MCAPQCWITNGYEADAAIVFATTDKSAKHKGISAFIVPKPSQGLSLGKKEDKMGIRGSSTCNLVLEDVRLPADALLGGTGLGNNFPSIPPACMPPPPPPLPHRLQNRHVHARRRSHRHCGSGAGYCAGGARGCNGVQHAAHHVWQANRVASGHARARLVSRVTHRASRVTRHASHVTRHTSHVTRHTHHTSHFTLQAIQFKLADMALKIEAARLLTLRAAVLKDDHQPYTKEAAMAKLAASEAAAFVTHQAIQIYGGYGYVSDNPVERHCRCAL